jgi:hypothetical protein
LRKPKGCAICREKFMPFSTLAKVCGTTCAIEWAKRQRVKAEKKQTREWRKTNMTRGDLLKKAQTEFNRFIRLRDHDKPCISCDTIETGTEGKGGRWDCSHYRSVGSAPELRFEELNAHRACKKCNQHLSGNIVEYRARLIVRIGPEKLAWLEGPHPVQKYSRDDLREIADKYRAAANQLHKMIQTAW